MPVIAQGDAIAADAQDRLVPAATRGRLAKQFDDPIGQAADLPFGHGGGPSRGKLSESLGTHRHAMPILQSGEHRRLRRAGFGQGTRGRLRERGRCSVRQTQGHLGGHEARLAGVATRAAKGVPRQGDRAEQRGHVLIPRRLDQPAVVLAVVTDALAGGVDLGRRRVVHDFDDLLSIAPQHGLEPTFQLEGQGRGDGPVGKLGQQSLQFQPEVRYRQSRGSGITSRAGRENGQEKQQRSRMSPGGVRARWIRIVLNPNHARPAPPL